MGTKEWHLNFATEPLNSLWELAQYKSHYDYYYYYILSMKVLTDWVRFCGASYANVVKKNITKSVCKQLPGNVKRAVNGTVCHPSNTGGSNPFSQQKSTQRWYMHFE